MKDTGAPKFLKQLLLSLIRPFEGIWQPHSLKPDPVDDDQDNARAQSGKWYHFAIDLLFCYAQM